MKKKLKPTSAAVAFSVCCLVVIGFGAYLVFNYLNKSALKNQPTAITDNQNNIVNTDSAPSSIITYLISKEDPIKYCNGADMDSAGYQKTITVKESTSTLEINPTRVQIIKAVINAATSGNCRSVLNQLEITENNGIVSIPPINAWAGVSITMCSCKPQVETNLLQIPGIKKIIWSSFAENTGGESSKADLIRVDYPLPNQVITSPVSIKGQARGSWFFEASFPVFLVDWDGKIIAQGIARAKSNWMTAEFVPFEAALSYTAEPNVYSPKGALILRKDNPSGLPANDNALEIPVIINGDTGSVKACTQEAKLCADGSYVGRTGPNCEFTPCP